MASAGIQYTYIAVRPLTVEHPLGSGTIVSYEPGEVIPAEEWGNAAHTLVEMGKAERLAINPPVGGGHEVAPPAPPVEEEEDVALLHGPVNEDEVKYPVAGGGGWFTLSDGSRVRGQEASESAQAELDAATEG